MNTSSHNGYLMGLKSEKKLFKWVSESFRFEIYRPDYSLPENRIPQKSMFGPNIHNFRRLSKIYFRLLRLNTQVFNIKFNFLIYLVQ